MGIWQKVAPEAFLKIMPCANVVLSSEGQCGTLPKGQLCLSLLRVKNNRLGTKPGNKVISMWALLIPS
jgi:hypothetical protein